VTPDGSKVYVANYEDNTVSVIDTATNIVNATIPVGTEPFGVAVTPDGSKVYVANQVSNNVSVIATATNVLIGSPIGVGTGPTAFGIFIIPPFYKAGVAGAAASGGIMKLLFLVCEVVIVWFPVKIVMELVASRVVGHEDLPEEAAGSVKSISRRAWIVLPVGLAICLLVAANSSAPLSDTYASYIGCGLFAFFETHARLHEAGILARAGRWAARDQYLHSLFHVAFFLVLGVAVVLFNQQSHFLSIPPISIALAWLTSSYLKWPLLTFGVPFIVTTSILIPRNVASLLRNRHVVAGGAG
jgi:YVTN family beta-propeller protein